MEVVEMYHLALEEIEAAKWHKVNKKLRRIWAKSDYGYVFSMLFFSFCSIAKSTLFKA